MKGKQKTIYILGVAVLLCLVSLSVYAGAFLLVKGEAQKASSAQLDLQDQEDKKNNADTVKKLLADTADARAKLDTYFLRSDQVVSFTHNLEKWALGVGVEASLSNLSERDGSLAIVINGKGAFNDLIRFLDVLENIPYSISIDSVNLTKSVTTGKNGNQVVSWSGSFDARILSYTKSKTP